MSQDSKGQVYRGRFAPSPSGPLHFGSLVAALGSFLQARSQSGEWLVRIEDLDPPREMPGADKMILECLQSHGLTWDGQVEYQSRRQDAYHEALTRLEKKQLLFNCSCSRKTLREYGEQHIDKNFDSNAAIYPGICRDLNQSHKDCAVRIKVNSQQIMFADKVFGLIAQDLENDVGDFVLKRRDGLIAYQLAVVVDDIWQGITEVVRGVDLLDSTPRQLYLYQCLDARPPDYLHLPLAVASDGKKLSKQTHAQSVNQSDARENLINAMTCLGMNPGSKLIAQPVDAILNWGISNWNTEKIPNQNFIIESV